MAEPTEADKQVALILHELKDLKKDIIKLEDMSGYVEFNDYFHRTVDKAFHNIRIAYRIIKHSEGGITIAKQDY